MNEIYKSDPTYQLAMRHLGTMRAKKLLGNGDSSAVACPTPNATEEQKSEYIQARSAVHSLLHEEAAASSCIHPDAASERDRIQELDAIADLYDPAIVKEAKYGDCPITAREMAARAAQGIAKRWQPQPESCITAQPSRASAPAPAQSPAAQTQVTAAVTRSPSPQSHFSANIPADELAFLRAMCSSGTRLRARPKSRLT